MGANGSKRALILIADVPEGAEQIKRCLSPLHDLVLVHNLAAATRLIANVDFDAVVAGVQFDDSRMIELLRSVRSEPRFEKKPFIAVRMLPTTMTPDLEANAKQMATVLGATAYVTIDEFSKDSDVGEQLLTRISSCLH
jgi:CheY-like chemotaxis protein